LGNPTIKIFLRLYTAESKVHIFCYCSLSIWTCQLMGRLTLLLLCFADFRRFTRSAHEDKKVSDLSNLLYSNCFPISMCIDVWCYCWHVCCSAPSC
jgi:hypothetical protein